MAKKKSSSRAQKNNPRETVHSLKAKANAKRTFAERSADGLTRLFGTITFLFVNGIIFITWITWNTGLIADVEPFDPAPFGLLTMLVSLEAIVLTVIVLISQNREAHIAELREEMELFIGRYSESEITKILHLQMLLLKKHGIDVSKDTDVEAMLNNLETDKIERELEKQLQG